MAPHQHSFFQIVFVASGTAVHEIEGKVFEGVSGSIFFVRPYTVHRLAFPVDSECYVVYFTPEFIQHSFGVSEVLSQESDLYRLPGLAPFVYQDDLSFQLDAAETQLARERCKHIGSACQRNDPYDSIEAHAQLTLLLTMVARKYSEQFHHIKRATGLDKYVDKRARAALAFLKENFNRPLALSDVARQVNLTGTYLTHLLKQETGKSFKQLLDELRLENSKTLLAYTDVSVQKVASDSGFLDQAQFARRFKAYSGETPRRFRQLHQKSFEAQARATLTH